MHRFLLHNGTLHDTSEKLLSPGQVGFLNGWGVFSTLWVASGQLFAYERHFARMARDAVRMRVPFYEHSEELRRPLLDLVAANGATEATLRVAVVRNHGGLFEGTGITTGFDVVAFTTDRNNWGASARLGVVPQGRHAASEFAGAKVTSWAQNLTVYERAHDQGWDEVVLLNERGEVSECTSANLFIVKGQEVLTPPLSAGCLPGITRELLLEEIRVPGVHVKEYEIYPTDLEQADEVFITSSTRDLMPVSAIEGMEIRSEGGVRQGLQEAFVAYREQYIGKIGAASCTGHAAD